MKMIIINTEIAEKLRILTFDKGNKLNPIPGLVDGKEIYFLQAELKENKLFAKALANFEVCEVKEIETVEQKYFYSKDVEVLPTLTKDSTTVYIVDSKEVDPMTLTCKTILTESKIIPK